MRYKEKNYVVCTLTVVEDEYCLLSNRDIKNNDLYLYKNYLSINVGQKINYQECIKVEAAFPCKMFVSYETDYGYFVPLKLYSIIKLKEKVQPTIHVFLELKGEELKLNKNRYITGFVL